MKAQEKQSKIDKKIQAFNKDFQQELEIADAQPHDSSFTPPWAAVQYSIANGVRPSNDEFAKAFYLSGGDIPSDVSDYLARLFLNDCKARRGRPKSLPPVSEIARIPLIRMRFSQIIEQERQTPKEERIGTPSEVAIERTAEGLSEEFDREVTQAEVRRAVFPGKEPPQPKT